MEEIYNDWGSSNASYADHKATDKTGKESPKTGGESKWCLVQTISLNIRLVVEINVARIGNLLFDFQDISLCMLFNVILIVAIHIVVVKDITDLLFCLAPASSVVRTSPGLQLVDVLLKRILKEHFCTQR